MSIITGTARTGRQRLDGAGVRPSHRRDRAYRAVVLAVAALVMTGPGGAIGLLAPWSATGHHLDAAFELHRWHTADIAAYASLLVAGSLLASARHPRRSVVLVQAALVGAVLLGALAWLTPSPVAVVVPTALIVVLVVGAHPDRATLATRPHGSGSAAARGAAVAATPFLLANAWQNLERQLAGVGEHAELGHWAGAAALALTLLVAGWLGASSGPGARRLCAMVGATYAFLGTAALALPAHDGSWGIAGGAFALAVAVPFLLGARGRPGRTEVPS